MTFDFDTQLALRGAHTSKYDNIAKIYGTTDPSVIPMWVADMDFVAAPAIRAALQAEVDRGYFGYFADTDPANRAVAGWMDRRHGWAFDPGAVRYPHGVVNAFADVIAAFTEPGEEIALFTPVYHAFFRQIDAMGRQAVQSPLQVVDGRFEMDLDDLATRLTDKTRILTMCSPHNPGGRVWTADELRSVAAFCADHDLILIADEIHMDLTFPGTKFIPIAVAAPECLDRLVCLTAASKGFNIAGGETGIMITPDETLRRKLDRILLDRESSPNRFGMAMIKAAFTDGDDWMDAAQVYLADNFAMLRDRLNALPGVQVMDMRSTYLSWVDFRALGMSDDELLKRFVTGARVAPSPGPVFGSGGKGHMRLNVALPRATLDEAIGRIEAAFKDVQ